MQKDNDNKRGPVNVTEDWIVANYWREKIKQEARKIYNAKWLPMRFIFTMAEYEYHKRMEEMKQED